MLASVHEVVGVDAVLVPLALLLLARAVGEYRARLALVVLCVVVRCQVIQVMYFLSVTFYFLVLERVELRWS